MNAKNFIKKFNLQGGWNNAVSKEFVTELGKSLRDLLEKMNAQNNIKKFNECVKQIRAKYDGISNKISYGIPENVWNFFYKKQVVALREEFCPEESLKIRQKYEEEGERRKEYKKRIEEKQKSMQPKIVDKDSEFYYILLPTGESIKESIEEVDENWVIKDGYLYPTPELQKKFDEINELLIQAATNFVMLKSQSEGPKRINWLVLLGSNIERIHEIAPEIPLAVIVKRVKEIINLVVSPDWWDDIVEEDLGETV